MGGSRNAIKCGCHQRRVISKRKEAAYETCCQLFLNLKGLLLKNMIHKEMNGLSFLRSCPVNYQVSLPWNHCQSVWEVVQLVGQYSTGMVHPRSGTGGQPRTLGDRVASVGVEAVHLVAQGV